MECRGRGELDELTPNHLKGEPKFDIKERNRGLI